MCPSAQGECFLMLYNTDEIWISERSFFSVLDAWAELFFCMFRLCLLLLWDPHLATNIEENERINSVNIWEMDKISPEISVTTHTHTPTLSLSCFLSHGHRQPSYASWCMTSKHNSYTRTHTARDMRLEHAPDPENLQGWWAGVRRFHKLYTGETDETFI